MEREDADWLVEIPHSPVGREGKLFVVSEWPSNSLPVPPFPADSGMWKARERVKEAGPMGWRNPSPSCSVGTFLGQYYPDVNQRTQTHCFGTFILKAFGRLLKLSNKTREAIKNTFKKNCAWQLITNQNNEINNGMKPRGQHLGEFVLAKLGL